MQVTGALSAGKALLLLRLVAENHAHGLRLKDLIELSNLDRSTAHRLLGCLIEEGFVDRSYPGKLYRLGVEATQFRHMSAGMLPLIDRFRPMMQRLATLSNDTVFLMARSGDHAVCLHREVGSYPVKALVVQPGTRRPLGTSSVGVSILARWTDDDVAASYERLEADYRHVGMTFERLQTLIEEARRQGYSQVLSMNADTRSVGSAVRISANTYAGVSFAAIKSRMTAPRRRELGALLVKELAPLEWREESDKRSTRRR